MTNGYSEIEAAAQLLFEKIAARQNPKEENLIRAEERFDIITEKFKCASKYECVIVKQKEYQRRKRNVLEAVDQLNYAELVWLDDLLKMIKNSDRS